MATAVALKRQCARCGKWQPAERRVFSSHTHNYYCSDIDACARRVKRGNARQTA